MKDPPNGTRIAQPPSVAKRDRAPTFFEAETKVVALDAALLSLDEESILEDCAATAKRSARGLATDVDRGQDAPDPEFGLGSEHGESFFDELSVEDDPATTSVLVAPGDDDDDADFEEGATIAVLKAAVLKADRADLRRPSHDVSASATQMTYPAAPAPRFDEPPPFSSAASADPPNPAFRPAPKPCLDHVEPPSFGQSVATKAPTAIPHPHERPTVAQPVAQAPAALPPPTRRPVSMSVEMTALRSSKQPSPSDSQKLTSMKPAGKHRPVSAHELTALNSVPPSRPAGKSAPSRSNRHPAVDESLAMTKMRPVVQPPQRRRPAAADRTEVKPVRNHTEIKPVPRVVSPPVSRPAAQLPKPTNAVGHSATQKQKQFAKGSNPPSSRTARPAQKVELDPRSYPRFEAAPENHEGTELRPTTVPQGPYCAVNAPALADYQITREIASGGMGIVYEAFHRQSRQRVAVKYMREVSANEAKLVKRFLGEGIAASRIDHPGIADVFDFGHDNEGIPYLVMEYLEGENLGDRLSRGPLTAHEFLAIGSQLTEILAVAHQHGIIHRDLKPDNIFLVAGTMPRVKLLDFGVAKFLDDEHLLGATSAGQVLGTPYYMSPEQCTGATIDQRSDVYSLGCVFYQMLAGKVPFPGNIFDVILGHRQKKPHTLTSLNGELPSPLIQLVEQMMEKEPADRLATMTEVGARLSAVATASPQRPLASVAPMTSAASVNALAFRPSSSPRAAHTQHSMQVVGLGQRRKRRLWPLALAGLALVAATAITLLALI